MAVVGLLDRAVAVTADRGPGAPGGRYSFGSGCLVGPNTVLTAAHVVAGATKVLVRTTDLSDHTATVDTAFVGDPGRWDPDRPTAPDLALLTLDTAVDVPPMPLARPDRAHPAGLVERVRSVGYPWFGETNTDTRETVRVQVPVAGQILLSNREDGLLDFEVTIAPPPPDDGESQWSGMSGAPVTAAGRLMGIVTEHAPRKGPSAVAVIPLTALDADPDHPAWGAGATDPAGWWARLGVPGPSDLAVLPDRREAPYRATLREFGHALHTRMPQLLGREAELADIAAFATGAEPYRWLVGGAFAGKSALLYEAVAAGVLPDTVDVVSYFLTRRASDADGDRFLTAVVPQLEILLGWEHQTADRNRFNQAWQEAAANARLAVRHLLLVVDALDEDLHPTGTAWVSALLPTLVGPGAHVLVTSRPHPEIRDHVPGTHPLRTCPQITIEEFEGAVELVEQSKAEVDELTRGDDLDVDVLGLLAAAAGALTAGNLAALHTHPEAPSAAVRRKVRALLTERVARSLEPVGSPDDPRYQFAHEVLADHARANPDLADPEYRARIHAWALTWADRGWPDPAPHDTGTPRYLLDTYPSTLLGDQDHRHVLLPDRDRLTTLAGDIGWVDAATRTLGVDGVLPTLLASAGTSPAREGFAHELALCVGSQATNLRSAKTADRGYVLRQLCFQAIQYGANDLAASLRTRLAALTDPGPYPIWTTIRTRAPGLELGAHDDQVTGVAVTPDGRVVTGGHDGRIRIWRTNTPGEPVEVGSQGPVRAVAVMDDGRIVAGGDDGQVLLWPTRPGRGPLVLGKVSGSVTAVGALPDGRAVTGDSEGHLRAWRTDTPGDPIDLGSDGWAINGLAVMRDGRVVTGGDQTHVRIWRPDAPDQPVEFGTDDARVFPVSELPDGSVLSGDVAGRVRVWREDRPGEPLELGTHDEPVGAVGVLADGRVVTGGADGRVRLWRLDMPGEIDELGTHDGPVWAVAVLPGGRVATGGADGRVRVWNADQPGEARAPGGSRYFNINAVRTLPDGRIVTGSHDGRLLLWKTDQPDDPVEIARQEMSIGPLDLGVLSDGRIVVTAWPKGARLLAPGRPGHVEEIETQFSVQALVPLRGNRIVTFGWGHFEQRGRKQDDWLSTEVCVWHVDNPRDAVRLGIHRGPVESVAALPDDRIVTGGGDGTVRLWRTERAGKVVELAAHDGRVLALATLPDGGFATGGEDGQLLLWKPGAPGHELMDPLRIASLDGPVWRASALPDGRIVTYGGLPELVQLWHSDQVRPPTHALHCPGEIATAHARNPKSSLLLIFGGQGLTAWEVPRIESVQAKNGVDSGPSATYLGP